MKFEPEEKPANILDSRKINVKDHTVTQVSKDDEVDQNDRKRGRPVRGRLGEIVKALSDFVEALTEVVDLAEDW